MNDKKELLGVKDRPCFAQIKHRLCNRHLHSSWRAARLLIPQSIILGQSFCGGRACSSHLWDMQLLGANLYFGSF
jgi:hypothetical protein